MRKGIVVAVVCALPAVAHVAHAQGRLDLNQLPDLSMYDAIWPLHYSESHTAAVGSFGLGFTGVRGDGGERRLAADATLGFGHETDRWLIVEHSELSGFADGATPELLRGRHRALAQLRTGEDTGVVASLGGVVDHGAAQGLSPLHLGAGRRTTGDAEGEALLILSQDCDCHFSVAARGTAGATRWAGGATAAREGFELALGPTPNDDELPHGMIDLVHGRVEHARITTGAAFAGAVSGRRDTEVRTVEVGLGSHDFTMHIDHELKAVITAEFGWSWLESDTPSGSLSANLYTMNIGAAGTWRERGNGRLLHAGLGIGRTPDYTQDGSRLTADWRLELEGTLETRRLLLGAHGGLSWLVPVSAIDGAPDASTMIRYGEQVEGFVKLGSGIEVGAYHAAHYEPAPGDPWASDRRWGLEAGVEVRFRTDAVQRMLGNSQVSLAY